MIQISPSILSADFSRLGEEICAVQKAGADMLHVDVMDGHFAPNISLGIPVIAGMRKASDIFFDVHIMITDPLAYIDVLCQAGADLISFHIEANSDPAQTIAKIKGNNVKAGIVINPATPAEAIFPYLKDVDLVLVMTVVPGFGGQKFDPTQMDKLRAIREECKRIGRGDIIMQVDGGITEETIKLAAAAGGNCFVAGSAIYTKADYAAAISGLRAAGESAYQG